MRAGRVGDQQRADVLVGADHLPVGVLDRRNVAVAERALHEAYHQRTLADAAGTEHHHAIIVALLGHYATGPDDGYDTTVVHERETCTRRRTVKSHVCWCVCVRVLRGRQ